MKKSPKSYWNYRIITMIKSYPNGIKERLFSIAEVHYENGKPCSYADKYILNSYLSNEELIWTFKKVKKAFKKPILDVDNNFKKWKTS